MFDLRYTDRERLFAGPVHIATVSPAPIGYAL